MKKSKISKSSKNENASFSGSNSVNFCLRNIDFTDEHTWKIKKQILHETRHIMMSTTKNCSGTKNKLHFTKKKLYEYPGRNQVDGLPPVSSQLPGDEKVEFCKLFCYSFRLRLSRGPSRHPEVYWNVSIDVI